VLRFDRVCDRLAREPRSAAAAGAGLSALALVARRREARVVWGPLGELSDWDLGKLGIGKRLLAIRRLLSGLLLQVFRWDWFVGHTPS
jgi:hypothetical protein